MPFLLRPPLLLFVVSLVFVQTCIAQPFTHNFGHADDVRELHFSSDGRLMASLGEDRSLHLRETDNWRTLRIIPGIAIPQKGRLHVAMLPNNALVYVTMGDQALVLNHSTSGKSASVKLSKAGGQMPTYALNTAGNRVYLAVEQQIHIFDANLLPQGTITLPDVLVGKTTELYPTPDGTRLVASSAGLGSGIAVFAIPNNTLIASTETEQKLLQTVADNEKVITKEGDDNSRFYSLEDLSGGKSFFSDYGLASQAVALSENAETILYGAPEGLGFVGNGKQAKQYEIRTDANIRYGHFFNNDTRLATLNAKADRIHIWNLETRSLEQELYQTRRLVKQLAFHPTDPVLLATYGDYLALFELDQPGVVAHRQHMPFDFNFNSFSVANDRVLLHGDNTKLQLADWPWLNPVFKIGTDEWIENPQLFPDGTRFVMGTEGELVQSRLGANSADYKIPASDEQGILQVRALSGNRVAVLYDDYVLKVFSETKTELAKVEEVWPFALMYDTKKERLVFAAMPNVPFRPGVRPQPSELKVLELKGYAAKPLMKLPAPLKVLPPYSYEFYAPIFLNDNRLFILKNDELQPTRDFKAPFAPVMAVAQAHNGGQFAFGDASGFIAIGSLVETRPGIRAHIKTFVRAGTDGHYVAINREGAVGHPIEPDHFQVVEDNQIKGIIAPAEAGTKLVPDAFIGDLPTLPLRGPAPEPRFGSEHPAKAHIVLIGDETQAATVERSFSRLLGGSMPVAVSSVRGTAISDLGAKLSPGPNKLTIVYFTDLQSLPEGALSTAIAILNDKLNPADQPTIVMAESMAGPVYNPRATTAAAPLVEYILQHNLLGVVLETGAFSPLLKWIYDAPGTKKFDRDYNGQITLAEFEDYLHRMTRLSRSEKVRLLTPQTRNGDERVLMKYKE